MGSGYNYTPNDPDRWTETGRIGKYKELREMKTLKSDNLPTYAKTSDGYFKSKNGVVTQLRIYGEPNNRGVRPALIDIDLGHKMAHNNKSDGTTVPAGVVHVHDFHIDANGKISRDQYARPLTFREMAKYQKILKKANPNVKIKLKFK